MTVIIFLEKNANFAQRINTEIDLCEFSKIIIKQGATGLFLSKKKKKKLFSVECVDL